jgi:signal transduction histidine kinase/ActR/RegA family two-component response regulator
VADGIGHSRGTSRPVLQGLPTNGNAATAPAPYVDQDHPGESAHLVQFYEDDAFLIDTMARFIGAGLGSGDAAVIIATEPHRDALDAQLSKHGLDLAAARHTGRYVTLDAARTLATFMRDDWPDATCFIRSVGRIVERAADGGRCGIRAFGEMVSLLWADDKRDAAIRLEQLWNDLAGSTKFSLLCAYPMSAFGDQADAVKLFEICGEHSDVIPAESYSGLVGADARLRRIAELQQKARALETEIAHRRLAEDAERRARAEAEAASRAKDEFLAMLGHELRNPLSAVRNAIVTARLDPSRCDRALAIANRGTDQLGRLVDDLLDVARITHGRIALHVQRLAFASVVERAIETVRPFIEERAHKLTGSLAGLAVEVDGDATRLEQVVANLLTNAAKYTNPGGEIGVTLELEGDEVVLRVRDSGMGLTPEMLPRVFDLFVQGDRALDRVQGGLGIGLTIVKRLVELHGGRVEARSDGHDRGAEFVVRLPAAIATTDEAAPGMLAGDERRGCARVILVEDNVDAAESLQALLEVLGHRVRVAGNGPRALAMAEADPPNVMLVDIGLPGMDGYEVARRARADARLRHVILVALTGYGREEDRERARDAGFDHHLVKPVDPSALHDLVLQLTVATAPASDVVIH